MSFLKASWRLVQPFLNYNIRYYPGILKQYVSFFKDVKKFRRLQKDIDTIEFSPAFNLGGKDGQTGGGHYFYQDIWALRILKTINPSVHYDIGSRYDGFVGQATAITKVIGLDIRKPDFVLPDFEFMKGDITALDISSDSVYSISCLHTLEHIGLGRYGDAINPRGYEQGLLELERIVKPEGHLIISFPIGSARIEFNAQRIIDPLKPLEILKKMQLIKFSVVNDENVFIENANPADYKNSRCCCGMYYFKKL